ncbi:hypothetical protein DBV15_04037 [Temnothorax longispinosus]|uniref:Uncharacterized protein n=1 Tax=Temnothorax longispinosus TaxID=300112 RepID=A0A4S2KFT9_9HYME|nr:hypothetical protein DBV15_04037 [Temnothorax longispinosus]
MRVPRSWGPAIYYRIARTVIRIWDGERERTVRRYISVNYIDRRPTTGPTARGLAHSQARPWDSCEAWVNAPVFLFAEQRSGGRSPRFAGSFRPDRSMRSPERNLIFTLSAGRPAGDENDSDSLFREAASRPALLHFILDNAKKIGEKRQREKAKSYKIYARIVLLL